MHPSARHVRWISLAEGVSYLFLLGVAMPLKYLADAPAAVRYGGWAHGLLFVILLVLITRARVAQALETWHVGVVFIASLIPFAPFVLDRKLRAWGSAA